MKLEVIEVQASFEIMKAQIEIVKAQVALYFRQITVLRVLKF